MLSVLLRDLRKNKWTHFTKSEVRDRKSEFGFRAWDSDRKIDQLSSARFLSEVEPRMHSHKSCRRGDLESGGIRSGSLPLPLPRDDEADGSQPKQHDAGRFGNRYRYHRLLMHVERVNAVE